MGPFGVVDDEIVVENGPRDEPERYWREVDSMVEISGLIAIAQTRDRK